MIIRAVVFPVAEAVTASAWSYPEYSFRWHAISDLGNPDNEKLKGSFLPMELGVHFVDYFPTGAQRLGPTLAEVAKTAEEAGMAMFTLADHFLGVGDPQAPTG